MSMVIDDLLKQLDIVIKAESMIMDCGYIYPAIEHITNAQKDIIEGLKHSALVELGIEDKIIKICRAHGKPFDWEWMEDFKKWREENHRPLKSK